MIKKLKLIINQEIIKYRDKRNKSEKLWKQTLNDEFLTDIQLYEGIKEGLSIVLLKLEGLENE